MISIAAIVIAIAAFAIAEGIVALKVEPATDSSILAAMLGIGIGSGLVVCAMSWWLWGHPPNLLDDEVVGRIHCLWTHGREYCSRIFK